MKSWIFVLQYLETTFSLFSRKMAILHQLLMLILRRLEHRLDPLVVCSAIGWRHEQCISKAVANHKIRLDLYKTNSE
jgi:hypothetical protein